MMSIIRDRDFRESYFNSATPKIISELLEEVQNMSPEEVKAEIEQKD